MKINWPKLPKRVALDRLAFYGIIGAVAIVIGTFAVWQLVEYFAPSQINDGGGTNVQLEVSDHSQATNGSKVLLPNSLADPTLPYYNDDISSGPTPFGTETNNTYSLFRIQGEIQYQ